MSSTAIHPFDDYVLVKGDEPEERPERDLFAGITVTTG